MKKLQIVEIRDDMANLRILCDPEVGEAMARMMLSSAVRAVTLVLPIKSPYL